MRYLDGEFSPVKEHLRYIAPAIAAALIAGGASIVGSGINAGVSMYNRNNDLQLLQYQNEYNSPKNMMKRLLEAGINPNAAAQAIAGNPGYGNMAPADASNVSNALPSDLGSQIGNSVNSALNAALVRSNIEKTKEETRGQKIANNYEDATFDARVQQALDSGAITAAEAEKARLYAEKYPEILDMTLEQMKATLEKTDKEIERIDQEIKESDKRISKLEQDIKVAKSQEAKNYAEMQLTKEKAHNQELRNQNLELTGEETGWQAEYRAIEKKDGKDAADSWLESTMEITNKVIANSSEASAQGQQNVVDDTPQGHIKRMYEEQMNKELEEADRQIEHYRKKGRKWMVNSWENEKNRIVRRYRNKMRRVDRGSSLGGSLFGFGLNAGG